MSPAGPDTAGSQAVGGSWPLAPVGRVVVEVRVDPARQELTADRLILLGASAVAEDAPGALVADLEPARVSELESWCRREHVEAEVRLREVDPAWADGWREHAVAHRVPPLVVRPPWVPEAIREGEVELVVDPGPTFGSGSHPTTRMCLAALADLVHGGESVLDVGVGSGVLAVGALVLGAASAVGVDIDPQAAAVSRSSAVANGVEPRYRFEAGGLDAVTGAFDIVIANLLIGTIEELGAALRRACGVGGVMVLSGLLDSQTDRALAAVGGRREATLADDGWAALVVR